MNPFRVPGSARPGAPLDPLRYPQHEAYYVPLGSSERAFARFKREIGWHEVIAAEGRLVVATGYDGTGKTSLINRCVAWLHRELASSGTEPHVLALRDDLGMWSVQERMKYVATAVLDEVRMRELAPRNALELLDRRVDEPEHFYRNLVSALTTNVFLLVLLPPVDDLVSELSRYLALTCGRIVFFTETRYVDLVHDSLRSLQRQKGTTPLVLDVGPLVDGDGWMFVKSRLRDENSLWISEETVRRVTEARYLSIGELQALLHGTYAERLERSGETQEVTLLDLMEFHFRRLGR